MAVWVCYSHAQVANFDTRSISLFGREKGGLLMVVQLLFLHIEAKMSPTIKVKFIKRKKRNKKVVSAKKQKQQ